MSGAEESGPLGALLRARAPAERCEALLRLEGLEALLGKHLEAGRAAWPSVPLEPEAFMRHLARHLPPEDTLSDALHQLHGADLYLACACAAGDSQALLAFERHVLQKVPSRLGQLAGSTVDEVLQVLRQRLLLGRGDTLPR
ncbi:MAG TPA: RNA polymerase subunit sigma-70, partial [Archangium sp.]